MRRVGFLGGLLTVVAALLLLGCSSGSDDDAAADDKGKGDAVADDAGEAGESSDPKAEGGGLSGDAAGYVRAFATSMQDDGSPVDAAQAECLAERWVGTIGVDRFKAAGVTPEDIASDDYDDDFSAFEITEAEGNELYDGFAACDIDIRAVMLEETADEEMSREARACMESVLSEENLRRFMVTAMVHGDDAAEDDPELAELMGGLMGCAFMDMGAEFGNGDG